MAPAKRVPSSSAPSRSTGETPKIKKNLIELFNEGLNMEAKSNFLPNKPLASLETGAYPITKLRVVHTRYGKRIVIDVDNEFQTFLPARVLELVGENENKIINLDTRELFLHYEEEVDGKPSNIYFVYHHNAQNLDLEEHGEE